MKKIKDLFLIKIARLQKIVSSFGLTEKTFFWVLAFVFVVSSLILAWRIESKYVTERPTRGGSLTEGLIGSPRFINPLLELSDSDRDLSYLVYSGLMRATASGDLIPDLAESYTVSDDGLTYTFKIRNNAYFHDGQRVTADDIQFTVEKAQDSALRSPKRNSWLGVAVEKVSDLEISFFLKEPYSPFLENTTIGILPKHIWAEASNEEFPFSSFNTEPIGSGPYQIKNIVRNNSGLPASYELLAFKDYVLGEPFITNINLNFYPNEEKLKNALVTGEIESAYSFSSQSLADLKDLPSVQVQKILLPRIFGVFFNQNQAKVFLNKEVRQALNLITDRDRIVTEVLNGYGRKAVSPVPERVLPEIRNDQKIVFDRDQSLTEAKNLLEKNGWKINNDNIWEKKVSKTENHLLSFTITTANSPELKKTAEILKEDWGRLGAKVEIQVFDPSDLNQTIISQRKYDALLFGQIINRSLDLFAFWHSSQRNTGYNVALYTNNKADGLLEQARQLSEKEKRLEKYALIETEIQNDIPAIFLYSPEFIYFLPSKIKGFSSGLINHRAERFEEIYHWYIETDKIWNFLKIY